MFVTDERNFMEFALNFFSSNFKCNIVKFIYILMFLNCMHLSYCSLTFISVSHRRHCHHYHFKYMSFAHQEFITYTGRGEVDKIVSTPPIALARQSSGFDNNPRMDVLAPS